jgi:hypothetical protein
MLVSDFDLRRLSVPQLLHLGADAILLVNPGVPVLPREFATLLHILANPRLKDSELPAAVERAVELAASNPLASVLRPLQGAVLSFGYACQGAPDPSRYERVLDAINSAGAAAKAIDNVLGSFKVSFSVWQAFEKAIQAELAAARDGVPFDVAGHLVTIRKAAELLLAFADPGLFTPAPPPSEHELGPGQSGEQREPAPVDALEIFIDPGGASVETIQEVLEALSGLHEAAGGAGLRFEPDDSGTCRIMGVPQ